MRSVRQAVRALPEARQALRDIDIGLWSEFAVRTYDEQTREPEARDEQTREPEARAFAVLFRTPAFSELYERGNCAFQKHRAAQSSQGKFLKRARGLFTQEFRPMWEHLAAQTDWHDRFTAHQLFDAREVNDRKRNAFFCV